MATDVRKISVRIQLVEKARKLSEQGQVVEALHILERVRETYSDPAKRQQVDRLIADLRRRG